MEWPISYWGHIISSFLKIFDGIVPFNYHGINENKHYVNMSRTLDLASGKAFVTNTKCKTKTLMSDMVK